MVGGLITGKHEGVVYAGCTIKLFGTRLNTYVYVTDGLLVDTGPSRYNREYANFFRTQPVKQVVLTHFHEDHSGNAPWLEKQGIAVYVHPAAVNVCRKPARLPFYRFIFWGAREKFNPLPVGNTLKTKHKVLQVLEVPGHSPDHIALYDPAEGAIFTGDLFVTPKTRIVMRPENIPQIMQSLRVLLRHDFQTVYCGHAGVVEEGKKMIQMKLDYLENLRGEVLELYNKGLSIKVINKKLFPKTAPLTYLSGKEWASEHIIRSIIEDS